MANITETKLCIIVDSKMPIIMKIPYPPHIVTLKQLKQITSLQDERCKFYFRSHDAEFGIVKEEIVDDDSILPTENGKIVVWVVSNQSSLFEQAESCFDGLNCEPRLRNSEQHIDNQYLYHQSFDVTNRGTHSLPRSITPRSLYATNNIDHVPSIGQLTPSFIRQPDVALHCGKDGILTIYSALCDDSKNLDLRDRDWLKVVIKSAFIGSELIRWLSTNVYGFSHKKEVKRYANRMLNLGLIRNPMSSKAFSEKCYYTLS